MTEIPASSAHLVDISEVSKNPYIKATLDKYKDRLQVERITEFTSPYTQKTTVTLFCKKYYKGLQIFFSSYHLRKQDNYVYTSGELPPDTVFSDIRPKVMINEAVRTARQKVRFNGNCIAFQLGLKEIHKGSLPLEYRLVWFIEDSKRHGIHVIVDAQTGEVISFNNGLRIM